MEDGASEFSDDWEVLSAASAPGGGGDDDDGVLVSGEGGDVLHDHFALVPSSPAADGSWSEAASDEDEDQERKEGLGFLDRFDSISRERMDLTAVVDSSAQLQLGGVDETAQGSVPGADVACVGAAWSAEEVQGEELDAEIEHDEEAACSCSELDSIPRAAHQVVGEIVDFHATAVARAGFQIELAENYSVQLEDGDGADATSESSVLEAAATGDAMQGGALEEPEQGKDASAASGCGESDGDPSPLIEAPGNGEGGRQVVVWWRLPFRLLHYCAWKVRPVWSISIAAALLGLVVLGRRMYRMPRKTRDIPQIKIAFNDKRASQFAERVTRLNEAFLIAKRVPALITSSGAVLPWSMVQER